MNGAAGIRFDPGRSAIYAHQTVDEPRSESESAERTTPMMRQYLAAKDAHPGAIVLFRMGDFFETFFEDAQECSRILEITLTKRSKEKDAPPMAGVPARAIDGYVARLIEAGRTVVFVDQVEDPKLAKGLVRRAVTRIATPGTYSDESAPRRRPIYLSAVALTKARGKDRRAGLAALDLATGEFVATAVSDAEQVIEELARLGTREVLVEDVEDPWLERLAAELPQVLRTKRPSIGEGSAKKALEAVFGAEEVESLGKVLSAEAFVAAGAAMAYALETQLTEDSHERKAGGSFAHVQELRPYVAGDALVLDAEARAHLELFESAGERSKRGSLFGLIDGAVTAMGGRLLARWLARPLTDVRSIKGRLGAVSALVAAPSVRDAIRRELRDVHDLERLLGRVTMGRATPRDLGAIAMSLGRVRGLFELVGQALAASELAVGAGPMELLRIAATDPVLDVSEALASALVPSPPIELGVEPTFRQGFDARLDHLIELGRNGKDILLELERREQLRTGISSLKVKNNNVWGYFIEVTKPNIDRVPSDYIRKQTMTQAERYYTPELKEREEEILGADEKRLALESELFGALRASVGREARRIRSVSEAIAALDALAALANLADQKGWVEPAVDETDRIRIVEGRHPVIEGLTEGLGERFVPNDLELNAAASLMILTGPNMAGKSTIMRQTAEIVILAQMGSFVPARSAEIGLVDRIFTRVGASDDLSRGRSTFMVEMTETARILRAATSRSLILFDEIGRGTSTFDGLAIAWAVAEHVHDAVKARTIFATHYHELTEICREKERARNHHVAVKELGDRIVFLRKLASGPTNKSYGVHVARLAGLPKSVIARAREVLAALEEHDLAAGVSKGRQLFLFASREASSTGSGQASRADDAAPAPDRSIEETLAEELEELLLDDMSFRAAHAWLTLWKERLAERK
ncbi:MAG: DNA mismatch repair protein MutS [Deltaproteobacteria bacterium]|nr:DNA mismatch repair protein MutS [Deltaproteobacteria bacterium]